MTEAEKKAKSREYQKKYQAKYVKEHRPGKKYEKLYALMTDEELFYKGFEHGYENG